MSASAGIPHIEFPSETTSSSKPEKKPRKSILKNHNEHYDSKQKGATFDEMNILATYHPADKDYGHMKIDEPKTPYRCDEDDIEGLDPDDISRRLTDVNEQGIDRSRAETGSVKSDDDFNEDIHLSPEDQERKQKFREHRKKHYNMREQLQRAKELLAKEMAELEDE